MTETWLFGPFAQIVTMDGMPPRGPLKDAELKVTRDGGLLLESGVVRRILSEAEFRRLRNTGPDRRSVMVDEETVLLPGFVDSHTHMCYSGSRLDDYLTRLNGSDYAEIARRGGGILSTVRETRKASQKELGQSLMRRAREHLMRGVTTVEVKSGYGLDAANEIKMLKAIRTVDRSRGLHPRLVPTFLAAHCLPPGGMSEKRYLSSMLPVLAQVKEQDLASRVDAWIDRGAFSPNPTGAFLGRAKRMGFQVTVHADQFEVGGSRVAAAVHAVSADHLERSGLPEIKGLCANGVAATALPGSSIGLGGEFAKARMMLDEGLSLVIASDWNPGTAPSGDLLAQAAILGANQRLTVAETAL